MTATAATPTTCPKCDSAFVLTLDTGMMFCPECRNEWDPRATVVAPVAGRQAGESLADEQDLIDRVDALGNYSTFMHVSHDDGGSGNWRTDLFTYNTAQPHEDDEAIDAAMEHYTERVKSDVAGVVIFGRSDGTQPVDIDDLVETDVDELDDEPTIADIDAAAYLASLVGTGVTLEGGQRAIILSFEDDDEIIVQLPDGDTATVVFNDIVHADNGPPAGQIVEAEIDDATAQAFGTGSLLFACMVIEAGVASIEGDVDQAHLVESPTGWFITDEDAVPLMEQASAAAVAMLILTFALPRDELVEMVARVRNDALAATATEVTGNEQHTDYNQPVPDTGDAG